MYLPCLAGIDDAAAVVELEDAAQRVDRAVVHVGPTTAHIAKAWRLERPAIVRIVCHAKSSVVVKAVLLGIPADAQVAELLVREIPTRVAGVATRLVEEQILPQSGRGRQGLNVTSLLAVIRRVAAGPRAHIIGNRVGDALWGHRGGAERFFEVWSIPSHR
jgi:hypothetical protein